MPPPIRIGVVGAGANTRGRHIPGMRAIEGVEIIAVVNRSRASSERAAQELGIPHVHDTWRDLVRDPAIDAVMIGTWPYLHCPVTLAALEAGKHVLTEARMAMNAAEAHAMLATSRRHPDLVAMIVPAPFTFAVDPTVTRLLAEGYLGELQSVDLRVSGGFLESGGPLHWRMDRDLSGLNIMTLGIWYECLLRWLGPARSVTALTRVAAPYRTAERGARRAVQVPDHVEILAEFPPGAIARLHVSAVAGLMPGPEVWLFGSAGTLRFQQSGSRLFGARRGERELQEIAIPEDQRNSWRVE